MTDTLHVPVQTATLDQERLVTAQVRCTCDFCYALKKANTNEAAEFLVSVVMFLTSLLQLICSEYTTAHKYTHIHSGP